MAKSITALSKKAKAKEDKEKKNSSLKSRAEANTTITHKVGSDTPTVIKNGVPLDHETKHNSYENSKFGMSKGCTLNMDNYESMRIDCWLTDEVHPGETVKEAFVRVEAVLDQVLEESAAIARENN